MRESKDVVNEQQHILVFFISELFSNGETGETDSSSCSRGFVHLAVDECTTRVRAVQFDDTCLNHFPVQVISFSGPFTYSCEDGLTTVGLRDVIDQFHDQNSLADTCTSEESDFTSSSIRREQVHYFDFCD